MVWQVWITWVCLWWIQWCIKWFCNNNSNRCFHQNKNSKLRNTKIKWIKIKSHIKVQNLLLVIKVLSHLVLLQILQQVTTKTTIAIEINIEDKGETIKIITSKGKIMIDVEIVMTVLQKKLNNAKNLLEVEANLRIIKNDRDLSQPRYRRLLKDRHNLLSNHLLHN